MTKLRVTKAGELRRGARRRAADGALRAGVWTGSGAVEGELVDDRRLAVLVRERTEVAVRLYRLPANAANSSHGVVPDIKQVCPPAVAGTNRARPRFRNMGVAAKRTFLAHYSLPSREAPADTTPIVYI